MNKLVYAIKIADLSYIGLKILDVKIGQTTNINSTLAQYRRSNREVEILDLWESSPSKTLSECEKGIHKIAEKYAYEREGEKFIFLQESYKEFSENVSLLLKNIQRDKNSGAVREARVNTKEDIFKKCSSSQKEIIEKLVEFIESLDNNIKILPYKNSFSCRTKLAFANLNPRNNKVRAYFDRGYKLEDDLNILKGEGKYRRYVDVSSLEEISGVTSYIKQAYENSLKDSK